MAVQPSGAAFMVPILCNHFPPFVTYVIHYNSLFHAFSVLLGGYNTPELHMSDIYIFNFSNLVYLLTFFLGVSAFSCRRVLVDIVQSSESPVGELK